MKKSSIYCLGTLLVGAVFFSCKGEGEGRQRYTAAEQRDVSVRVGAATQQYTYPTLVPKGAWWIYGVQLESLNGKVEKQYPYNEAVLGTDTIYADWATVLAKNKSIEVLMQPNTSGEGRTVVVTISQGNTGGSLSVTQEP